MPETDPKRRPLGLFFSYAHEDKEFRDQLQVHLAGLKRKGIISDWYDGGITAGTEWSKEISRNLEASEVILLLISPFFINSEYCYDYEMKRALEKHEAGEARVIPVMIRDVDDWSSYPFAKLQVVPRGEHGVEPVENWANKNRAWVEVAQRIRLACNELIEMQQQATVAAAAPPAPEATVTARFSPETEQVVLKGNSVQLVNATAETVGRFERIREISVDIPRGGAAGIAAAAAGPPENRQQTRQSIDEALDVIERAGKDRGRRVKEVRAGDVQLSRVDLLLKKAILLHTEAEEKSVDPQLSEEERKSAYTAKLKEAYQLLSEANRLDQTNTEVLLQMAQVLVELTPDDPADELKLLKRIRKLLEEPKTDAEKFRLARATYMLAMTSRPPQVELLREPRAVFEKLGRVEWVQQCDRVLGQAEAASEEEEDVKEFDERDEAREVNHEELMKVVSKLLPKQPEAGAKERKAVAAAAPADFQPAGPWQFQLNDPVGSVMQINFNADGSFQGSQVMTMLGTSLPLIGRWGYNPFNRMLQLQVLANFQQSTLGINIQGPQNNGFHGIGTDGYVYFISRGGAAISPQQNFNPGFGSNFNFSDFGF